MRSRTAGRPVPAGSGARGEAATGSRSAALHHPVERPRLPRRPGSAAGSHRQRARPRRPPGRPPEVPPPFLPHRPAPSGGFTTEPDRIDLSVFFLSSTALSVQVREGVHRAGGRQRGVPHVRRAGQLPRLRRQPRRHASRAPLSAAGSRRFRNTDPGSRFLISTAMHSQFCLVNLAKPTK